MPRERIVAGIGADQKPDAELARLVHQFAEQIVVPLHAVEIELHLFGADLLLLAEFAHHGKEGGGRQDRHAGLGDGVEIAIGGEVGMHDPVDAGFGGRAGRAGAARVDGDFQVAPVRLADHRGDFFACASICDSPDRLSAILMKLTPCLPCRRTSVTISSLVLHNLPIE